MASDAYVQQIESDLLRERLARRVVDQALLNLMVERDAAVKALASMTKHAPSYESCVDAFADAHQAACELLDQMQKNGVEAAK